MDNPTVLVVDDEQLIRWSLTERLSQEGYRLLEAGTAADALARHREGVDLVLLDYRLPDGDGLAVLKQMKEADPDTIVILLTGHASVGNAVEAMKQGAYHVSARLSTPSDARNRIWRSAWGHAERSCATRARDCSPSSTRRSTASS